MNASDRVIRIERQEWIGQKFAEAAMSVVKGIDQDSTRIGVHRLRAGVRIASASNDITLAIRRGSVHGSISVLAPASAAAASDSGAWIAVRPNCDAVNQVPMRRRRHPNIVAVALANKNARHGLELDHQRQRS